MINRYKCRNILHYIPEILDDLHLTVGGGFLYIMLHYTIVSQEFSYKNDKRVFLGLECRRRFFCFAVDVIYRDFHFTCTRKTHSELATVFKIRHSIRVRAYTTKCTIWNALPVNPYHGKGTVGHYTLLEQCVQEKGWEHMR